MHSGKLVSTKRRLEHETQTRMFNGIQISNLETLIKISLRWLKALGYYTENHHTWLPSKYIMDQAHNLSFHKNGTRIDFNYHLILISLSCQKMFHTHEIEGWQPELIYGNFKVYWFTSEFSSSLIVTGRMPQSCNQMTGWARMLIGLVKTDGKKSFSKICQNEFYKLG